MIAQTLSGSFSVLAYSGSMCTFSIFDDIDFLYFSKFAEPLLKSTREAVLCAVPYVLATDICL